MPVDSNLALVLKSDHFGVEAPDLGAKLTSAYLRMLLDGERQPALILCMGSGVFLTTEGSPVRELLEAFAAAGTRIESCGTCLDYYGRRDKLIVGTPGNMRDTVDALLRYEKVLQP